MKTILTGALVLLAGVASARAEVVLDSEGGVLYAISIDGARASAVARTVDGKETPFEVVPQAANPFPIVSVRPTRLGISVQDGTSNTIMFAFFGSGAPAATSPVVLRDPRTGGVTRPTLVRTITVDPSDPGATLLDATVVVFPGDKLRGIAYGRRSSGEALLVDLDLAGGPVRRTPLGFTPPFGSNRGRFAVAPDGTLWAAFSSADRCRLYSLADVMVSSVVSPVAHGEFAPGEGFDPGSTRVGIIAILIGLLTQPTPAISFQVGDELRLAVPDGAGFRTVARQELPVEASGLWESEGINYSFLLPYLEQDNVYRGVVGGAAVPVMSAGH